MKPSILLFLFLPILLWSAPPAADTVDAVAAKAERAIERAGLRADAAALAKTITLVDAALAGAPNQPALLYARGYAAYVDAGQRRGPGERTASEKSLRDGLAFLERVKGAPWETEATALRATILGSLISLQPDPAQAGATLGMESGELMASAAVDAPASPRVLLFRGQAALFTPREYGGDPAEGAALIQQAVERFAAPGAPPSGPAWGRADALAWLGFARQQIGDLPGARAAWQQALAIEPDYAWVKHVLLPSLDQAPAKH